MNGRGKTKPYTMDDYIKDREQSWGKTETGSPMQAPKSSTGGFTVSRFTPPLPLGATSLQKQAMERRNQATGTVTTPPVEAPSVSVNAGSGAPEGGTVGAVPLTDVDVYKYQMDQARQRVYDVLNRKFKYNAKDSPLYTIMQQQYEREAERAAGRAYSSAVANTGGYGSSYATLAGEEARRQVMEGMDEAQYELYQAARQEFMDERQSAVDWYSQARQMYLDKLSDEEYRKQLEAEAGKTMSDSTYKLLIEASTGGWYKGDNENLLRAKLETYAAGDPGIDVDAIMGHLKREYDAWQADTEATGESKADPERVQTFYGAAYEDWDGTNEETVRTALKNQGATEAEINATVEMLKSDTDSQTNDAIKLFETEPTVSGAADIMAEAKLNGTADKYIEQVGGTLSKSIMAAMDKHAVGYKVLGVDQAAWDEASDDEKDEMLLDAAETAYKNGVMTAADFKNVVTKNARNSLELNKGRFGLENRRKGVLATVNGILSLSDDGTVTKGFAEDILDEIVKEPAVLALMDSILDEYSAKDKLGIDGLPLGIHWLTKAEEDAAGEILKAMYRTGVRKNEKADEIFESATNRFNQGSNDNPASKKKRWN